MSDQRGAEVLLMRGGLSGRIFAVTKWRERDGVIEAIEKHDVTTEFIRVWLECDEGWLNEQAALAEGVTS